MVTRDELRRWFEAARTSDLDGGDLSFQLGRALLGSVAVNCRPALAMLRLHWDGAVRKGVISQARLRLIRQLGTSWDPRTDDGKAVRQKWLDAAPAVVPRLTTKKGTDLLEALESSVAQAVDGSDSVFWLF